MLRLAARKALLTRIGVCDLVDHIKMYIQELGAGGGVPLKRAECEDEGAADCGVLLTIHHDSYTKNGPLLGTFSVTSGSHRLLALTTRPNRP